MPIAICPVPDGIMLAPILERISRPNRPVCDRLHGAPTAKMLGVFSQCKRSFMALNRPNAMSAKRSRSGGKRTQLGHRLKTESDPTRKWRVHRSDRK